MRQAKKSHLYTKIYAERNRHRKRKIDTDTEKNKYRKTEIDDCIDNYIHRKKEITKREEKHKCS